MSSCRKNPCQAVTNFFGSFFRQARDDFEVSYEKRKDEPLYKFTRYIPRTEDFPLPPSSNRYTFIRQAYNVLAIASWFQSKGHFATGLALTPVFNAFLQHAVYPSLSKNDEVAEPKTILRRS